MKMLRKGGTDASSTPAAPQGPLSRNEFIRLVGLGSLALAGGWTLRAAEADRAESLHWFREARFGLFMHYGLYSLLGRGEWVQYWEKIPVSDYERLAARFTAERFDATAITDLALAAGMRYVNITSRHHDSFCLFETKQTDFNSARSPSRRDLIAELAEQCGRKGLGLCLYYSHGRDWRHPHAPNNDEWGGSARPKYDVPDPAYAVGPKHDLQQYLAFMKNQITELLTQYGPVAAIWLDGIAVPKSRPDGISQFHCQELYDHIHRLQPKALVAYKQGLTGTEDFLAPERAWKGASQKPLEICNTLQPKGWGYVSADDGKHKSAEDVRKMLATAAARPGNLLLNTGLLPDGSVSAEDARTLRAVGKP